MPVVYPCNPIFYSLSTTLLYKKTKQDIVAIPLKLIWKMVIDHTEQAKFFHSVRLAMSVKLNQKLTWAYTDTPLD